MRLFIQIKLTIISIFLFSSLASYGALTDRGVWVQACIFLENTPAKPVTFNFTGSQIGVDSGSVGNPSLNNASLTATTAGLTCVPIGNSNKDQKLYQYSRDVFPGNWTIGYSAPGTSYSGSAMFDLTFGLGSTPSVIKLTSWINNAHVCPSANLCDSCDKSNSCQTRSLNFPAGGGAYIIFRPTSM